MGSARWIRYGADDELVPLTRQETCIRITGELGDDAHRRVAALMASRDDVELSVETGADVEWLRWYPGLRRLAARSLRLRSLEGLRHVADSLESLSVGDTLRKVSLRPIADLGRLRRLAVNGSWKDTETVGRLVSLERLGIGSIDLEVLLPLTRLAQLVSGVGTVRSLDVLPEIGRLELIELYRLRGEHDLTPISRVRSLRYLVLESTRSITTLPSLADCIELRWIALEQMRGITDLRPIADAPNLEVLLLIGMPQLSIDDLRPLVGHPALRAGMWGLGSIGKNEAAQALLPLPPSGYESMPWDRPEWTGPIHPART